MWEEKFLACATRKWYKDVLLGKKEIPTSTDEIITTTAEGKKKTEIKNLNELAYQDLILSINGTKKSGGSVAFQIGSKTINGKDYVDGNAAVAWQHLKEK